jgi:D-alanine-D-alanine ligase
MSGNSKRKLRILVLMHEDLVPPDSIEGMTHKEIQPWKTEYDVTVTLRDLDHDVQPLGVSTDLGVIRMAMFDFKPHITFNLLEEFHGISVYDYHVVSYLELLKRRYTGCNPRGLLLAHDKALAKKVLAFHRIPVPDFAVFPMGRKIRRPRRLEFPLMVKSLTEEGSVGIARASVVKDDEQLKERAEFIHRQLGTDAIAEQFIEGRELYVGIVGNQRLRTFPIWELKFTKAPDAPLIATSKVKWDLEYQKKLGIKTSAAKDLEPAMEQRILKICKRAYKLLNLTGYARMDLRLTAEGKVYLLEANPNPELQYGEDFAESARAGGMDYEELLQRIVNLGLSYRAQWQDS